MLYLGGARNRWGIAGGRRFWSGGLGLAWAHKVGNWGMASMGGEAAVHPRPLSPHVTRNGLSALRRQGAAGDDHASI